MAADVYALRSTNDRAASERTRARAEAELERVKKVAKEIRQMTSTARIYQERLDGRRVDDKR